MKKDQSIEKLPLRGRILPCKEYTKVGEEMTWPSIDQGDLEWILRYGSLDRVLSSRMLLASIVSAYTGLLMLTNKRRNEICRAIRQAVREDELTP